MSVISTKNQVTLPVEVMRAAGLASGDDIQVVSTGPGRIEVIRTDELIDKFAGSLDERVYPDGYLEEIRRGWA